ncbi:MAG: hypothetical protein JJE09_00250 [Bacteroidia bacterium]|nr:hypothetical protein [Bacteroidia bacterium]
MSKDFAKLVVVAFALAIPITWYCIENLFLTNFAYRIGFDLPIVFLAGLAAFIIAVATISFQAIKAALNNPMKALKNE